MLVDQTAEQIGVEMALSTYQSSGVPKWVLRQCLESTEHGFSLNNQKLSNLLAVVAKNGSRQHDVM